MTKDKWSQAKQFDPNKSNKDAKSIQKHDFSNIPDFADTLDNKLAKAMLLFDLTLHATSIACDMISTGVYEQNPNITVYQGLTTDNPIVKHELELFYNGHNDAITKATAAKSDAKKLLDYDSFDEFYENLKSYSQKLDNQIIDDFDNETVFKAILDDILIDETTDSYFTELLAYHILHEHYHKHILKNFQTPKLPCGHDLPQGVNPQDVKFCPICGKPNKN